MAVIVLSGQRTVTTAGTAVRFTTTAGIGGPGDYLLKALPANTAVGYVGNDGADDVTSANGLPISAGEVVPVTVTDLYNLMWDSPSDGQGVAWFRMGGQLIGVNPPTA